LFLGAGVGFTVGLTGVGGGSLMTPLLVFLGIPIKVAIGTDLLYAAFTKSSGALIHSRLGNIRWHLVFLLASGSIPGSILTAFFLRNFFSESGDYLFIFNHALGLMLVLTATSIFIKRYVYKNQLPVVDMNVRPRRHAPIVTVITGLVLGILVTLSSVGAGAFCAALLLLIYPRIPTLHIIGTDIAHAVPLTLVAGITHMIILQSIDWQLLLGLIIGSIPAVQIGAKIATKVSSDVLQPVLAGLLLVIGLKFIIL
jgi:uncharacterized membrane protein YfcA